VGEQCDPGPGFKKWYFQCCNWDCSFRKANLVCENRANVVCQVAARCDGKGHCMHQNPPEYHPLGFHCEYDRANNVLGTCNGKGKCLKPQ